MADLLDGLARYLDGLGLMEYDPDGVTGNVFIETMPSRPDRAVSLTIYGGPESDALLGWDEVSVQVRTRAGTDPRTSRQWCTDIRGALHGLTDTLLPGGLFVSSCIAMQAAPIYIAADSNGRHEHTCNFRVDVRSVTAHRV